MRRVGYWGLVIFWSLVLGHWNFSRADSVFVGTLERKDATIKTLKSDALVFEINDKVSEIPISKISRIIVSSDPPVTSAEEEYASREWDSTVDYYQKAIRTTNKQWVKDWSAMRLIYAAGKTGRFDAAATAYIITLLRDPVLAAKIKPAMPNSKSAFLDSAVQSVNDALKNQKLTVDQRRSLFGFMIDLQQARKDQNAEDAAYDQLAKLPGADVNDPAARLYLMRRHLAVANHALDAKDFKQAISEIDANRAIFTELPQQADALYILAEAHYGLAANDAAALKDAALAYMRVVALAKDAPEKPHVVASLL